ncbi:MAG: hypothetical protein WCW66_01905 [Patescibacteria group bacterium]
MLQRLEKINAILILAGLIVLAGLIIYAGVYNLVSGNHTSLGDPYYSNQISVFERSPAITWTLFINLILLTIHLVFTLRKRK